jgi:ferrous iron transport protein B
MVVPQQQQVTSSDHLDRWLTHKVFGLAAFVLIMFVVFQSISTLAAPVMQLCEAGQQIVGDWVSSLMSPGPFRSLLVDGVIGGVGGILVFLPQICFLFFFIALLEDCGYMARAAFLMDKLMTKVGLSGKSFVPLMSSFACAIPGIMATRTIENRRDRMVTILVAPLMSCSARFPVYTLMIAAFFPDMAWAGGWITLRGVLIFVMTFFGAFVAIPVAWLLKKTMFRGETPPFVMELPSYKWPSVHIVLLRVYESARAFVIRAGTLIFATSILIWAASYFPGDHTELNRLQEQVDETKVSLSAEIAEKAELEKQKSALPEKKTASEFAEIEQKLAVVESKLEPLEALITTKNAMSEHLLETSYLGRFGKTIEPAVKPLGWDWRIGVGVLASFPAREVIVSTLGTIYSLGGDVDEADSGLQNALRESKWPDNRPVYSIPVAISIMVFFALCAQCVGMAAVHVHLHDRPSLHRSLLSLSALCISPLGRHLAQSQPVPARHRVSAVPSGAGYCRTMKKPLSPRSIFEQTRRFHGRRQQLERSDVRITEGAGVSRRRRGSARGIAECRSSTLSSPPPSSCWFWLWSTDRSRWGRASCRFSRSSC